MERVVEASAGRNQGKGRPQAAVHRACGIELSKESVELAAGVELPPPGVAAQFGDAMAAAIAEKDVHGNAGSVGPKRREAEVERKIGCALHHQTMALIVGRRTVFAVQIGGIKRWVAKRYLIVVRIVQRFRKGIRAVQLEMLCEAMIERKPQRVIMCIHGGLQIGHRLGPTRSWIEDGTQRHTDDEMGA